jgi:hypothetical protein
MERQMKDLGITEHRLSEAKRDTSSLSMQLPSFEKDVEILQKHVLWHLFV